MTVSQIHSRGQSGLLQALHLPLGWNMNSAVSYSKLLEKEKKSLFQQVSPCSVVIIIITMLYKGSLYYEIACELPQNAFYKYNLWKRAYIQSVKWETTGGSSHQLEGSTREQWSNYEQLMKQQSENTSCLTIVGALITILLRRVNYSWSALPRSLPQEGVRDFGKKENAAGKSAGPLFSFLDRGIANQVHVCVMRFSLCIQSNTTCTAAEVLELLTCGSLTW